MRLVKLLLSFIFLLTLFTGSALSTAAPQNPCLMIPEFFSGQSAADQYQPDSCLTLVNDVQPVTHRENTLALPGIAPDIDASIGILQQ